jgi:putative redox protein
MKAQVKWVNGMQFIGSSGSGHAMVIDGAPEVGGENTGMRPMEMLLMSMGSCSAMDVVFIARRARQDISACVVEVTGERAETVPKVFTSIHVHYKVSGKNLDEQQIVRAITMSADKYCSVAAMMKQATQVTHDYEIVAE